MKIHVVTVGTGILSADGPEWDQFNLLEHLGLEPGVAGPEDLANKLAESQCLDSIFEAAGSIRQKFTLANVNQEASSAELQSLVPVNGDLMTMVETGDRVVLLASDTPGGIESAVWVAATLRHRSKVNGGWTFQTLSSGTSLDLTSAGITILRVPGLRASERELFVKCMVHLGGLFAQIHNNLGNAPGHNSVVLHLSGGYKAMVPFMISLGEGLRSLGSPLAADHRTQYSVHAVICHLEKDSEQREEGPERAAQFKVEPVTIPLRRYDLLQWCECTQEIMSGRSVNGREEFSDVIYKGTARAPKFTEFGEALAGMLFGAGKLQRTRNFKFEYLT